MLKLLSTELGTQGNGKIYIYKTQFAKPLNLGDPRPGAMA